jgi:chromosome segregation ATPase
LRKERAEFEAQMAKQDRDKAKQALKDSQ